MTSSIQGGAIARWPDYDDFLKDTSGDDHLRIDGTDLVNDWVFVRNASLGQSYRLTTTQATQEGIHGGLVNKSFSRNSLSNEIRGLGRAEELPKLITHVCDAGSPLCRFTSNRLVEWPKGHDWMSLQAWHLSKGKGCSCWDCNQAAAELNL